MIEAIPLSGDCLMLVMTKVNDPEELDARFSHFTAPPDRTDDPIISPEERVYADEIISCMEQLNKLLSDPIASKIFKHGEDGEQAVPVSVAGSISRTFAFSSLDEVIHVSKVIGSNYDGTNTLYKDAEKGIYFLVLYMSGHTPEQFNKICNIISEYITMDQALSVSPEIYIKEHCETIVKDKAVQVLKKL